VSAVPASGIGTADAVALPSRARRRAGGWGDAVFTGVMRAVAGGFVLLVLAIAVALVVESLPAIRKFGWGFVVGTNWDPVAEHFGALPFIYGTLVSSLLALAIAVPLGIGAAIFLAELSPFALRGSVGFLIELLAAIPSVVYGLWGIFVLAPLLRTYVQPFLGATLGFLPLFQGPPYGVGMLAAGIILAIMVVPFIATVSREVLLAVPRAQREAALALGAIALGERLVAVYRSLQACRTGA
jgi:phosphate transport system permease protein